MSIDELLDELRSRGIALSPSGGRLVAESLGGALTPDLAAALAAHKAAILARLRSPVPSWLSPSLANGQNDDDDDYGRRSRRMRPIPDVDIERWLDEVRARHRSYWVARGGYYPHARSPLI